MKSDVQCVEMRRGADRIPEAIPPDLLALIESAPDGFCMLAPDFRIAWLNTAAERLLGVSRAELLGKASWRTWPSALGTIVEHEFLRAMRERVTVVFEYYYAPWDRWFEIKAFPAPTEGIGVYFRDITVKKQAEERFSLLNRDLRRRVKELETLLELIPIGIGISDDAECSTVRANPAFAAQLGIDAGRNGSKTGPGAEALPFRIMRDGKEVPGAQLPLQVAAREGIEVRAAELELLRDDGTIFHLYGHACPLFNEAGKTRGAIGAFIDVTERKRVERALRDSEERLRSALKAANMTTWELDLASGRVRSSGPGSEQPPAEASLGDAYESVLAEDREQLRALVENAIRAAQPFNVEYRTLQADGSIAWTNLSGRAAYDAEGRPVRVAGMAADVTERKRGDAALRESEEKYRLLTEAMAQFVWTMFADGRLDYCNRYFREYSGFSGDEARDSGWTAAIHPDDLERTLAVLENARRRQAACEMEVRLRRMSDGACRWHLARVMPVRDRAGTVVKWLGTALDIDRQKRAGEVVKASEQQLRLALRAAKAGCWDWDLTTGDMLWSEECFEICGIDRSVRPSFDLFLAAVSPEDRERIRRGVESSGAGESEVECRITTPEGQRWLSLTAGTRLDESGRPVRRTGIAMDITARKRAEEDARQRQKLEEVGLLAGGIAHDFNNLLVGIMGGISFAVEALPSSHAAQPMLDIASKSCERAAQLTRQLLAYAGKGRFCIERLDLSRLVQQTCELLHASIPKSVELRLETGRHLPAIESDAGQLQQVIMNLVINAAEAIGPDHNGVIRVRTAFKKLEKPERAGREGLPQGTYVVLEVQDTGCGMDGTTLSRIFDPFFSTKFTGRGLGLAAVHGIVRAHRGSIEVDSRPGRGSLFRVLLPAAEGAVGPQERKPEPAPAVQGNGLILVVDDEPEVRRIAQLALERFGYAVILAEDGAQAVAAVEQRTAEIALVLLDLNMPGMNPRTVVQKLRKLRPRLPVVISSGYSEVEVSEHLRGRGISGFVQKPYTFQQLGAVIRRALERSRESAAK